MSTLPESGAVLFDRQRRLGQLLLAWRRLWQPRPHRQKHLPWCAEFPSLQLALSALDDAQVASLSNDNSQLIAWIAQFLPDLAELSTLIAFPQRPASALPVHWSVVWGIPGRKLAQIQALISAVGQPQAPLLEWCSGKGHLGRCLAQQHEVLSLDRDLHLVLAGAELNRRVAGRQSYVVADALAATAAHLVSGRHVLALHACGDLHAALIDAAATHRAVALDIVPCCYHRSRQKPSAAGAHQVFVPEPADLRLAVTETVTAPARENRHRRREAAWKCAFAEWRNDAAGATESLPLAPIPSAWDHLDFVGFQCRLAGREGIAVPLGIDWLDYEQRGWDRLRRTERLNLPRFAFRRAVEVWLVLERASMLVDQGYHVSVATFCSPQLTPRNLLISAR